MMNKKTLSPDFQGEQYGLKYRLVNEKDAEDIVRLRNSPHVGIFLHETSTDVEDQVDWIKEYKKREKEGRDYYFIFFKDNKPIALDRIYNINTIYATPGSWVIDPNYSSFEIVLATLFIMGHIMFDVLEIELSVFEVVKQNKQVLKYHKLIGSHIFTESEKNYFFYRNKADYKNCVEKFSKFLSK